MREWSDVYRQLKDLMADKQGRARFSLQRTTFRHSLCRRLGVHRLERDLRKNTPIASLWPTFRRGHGR